ncbi:transmembrane protease serine 2-like [Uloborus diversus]|uniref:transmembrane protease serine 2-like n=1 Tax=Uloborus diversus TaxID=327109 RepID=UPI00240A7E6C|nr:transmembrane protease serine 2-like [Uloborus diversus]
MTTKVMDRWSDVRGDVCHSTHADSQERCPKTFNLKNGAVRFQSRGGTTAIFTCDGGFVLRGTNVSHCQTDGHWSALAPTCIPIGQKCSTVAVENIILAPGETKNVSCYADVVSEEKQKFWSSSDGSVETVHNTDGTLTLTIQKQGVYTCLSHENGYLNILRAVNVSVVEKSRKKSEFRNCSISFKDSSSILYPTLGSHVSISCEANVSTVYVYWFKNGTPIKDGNSLYSSTAFNISSFNYSDQANYSCIVHHRNLDHCKISKFIKVIAQNLTSSSFKNSCGKPVIAATRRSRRVIDGSRATPLSAPWMCMLSLDREPPFCGCSLISDKWVVTAAHCFKSANKESFDFMTQEEIQKKVRVKFGKQQRRQEKGEVIRGVQSFIPHPHFKPISSQRNTASEHDIAVLMLNEPITFQPNILPICLPPPSFIETIPSGMLGVVTGWGRVSVRDSVMALTLQEAYLPLVHNSLCQESTNYLITDNMLCAGYAESYRPDTCFGDSGGPFVLQKDSRWFLAGVVSWGEGCSSPRKFGIYTKVEKYVSWIKSLLVD